MTTANDIIQLVQRIVQFCQPRRIILFGSYATGHQTVDSDVDLLVIMSFDGKAPRKSAEILNAVAPNFPIDLLVRTPDEVEQRLAWNDFFLRDIVEKGTVLYAAADA